jgi:hypothetical protein
MEASATNGRRCFRKGRTLLQSSHHLHIGILLIVEDVGLEHSNGARDQQYDDTQGNENLHHSE